MHLALLVGGSWFISDFGEPHSAGSGSGATYNPAWESNTLNPTALTYGLFDDHNTGETLTSLPRNNDSDAGRALPGGAVQGIGLWVTH